MPDDPLLWQSRSNRKQMNEAEVAMWGEARREQFGVRFRRQPIVLGFLLDFACISLKIALEMDGSQHADSETDRIRDEILRKQGWLVLRFWSWEIFTDHDMVIATVAHAVVMRSDDIGWVP